MRILDHFGLLAPVYEKFIPPPIKVDWQMLLRLPVRGKILDACGGTGRVAQLLTASGGPVIVLDASLPMLGEARLKLDLHPTGGTGEQLPFCNAAFERILMVDAFHHLADPHACAQELWRVLQPGGRLVIEEPDIDTFVVKWIAVGEKLLLMRSHFWRAEKIAGLFSDLAADVQISRRSGGVWVIIDRREAD